jgi:hypothetical protein
VLIAIGLKSFVLIQIRDVVKMLSIKEIEVTAEEFTEA